MQQWDLTAVDAYGVGADDVLKLTSTLLDNKNFKVYVDNIFTGLPLIEELQKHGIQYVGRASSSRIYKCTLQSDRDLEKGGRGTYDFRVEQNHNFMAVKWHDTRAGPEPTSEVRRWDKKQKITFRLKYLSLSENTTLSWVELT